jgi:RimJ/RimL family protein N-acetyltransferase
VKTESVTPQLRRTERLVLRRPTVADLDALVAIHTDDRLYRHSPDGAPSESKARRMVAEFIGTWNRYGIGFWVLEHDGAVIGSAGIKPTHLAGQDCWNLYYRLVVEAWGQGFAGEATRAAIDVASELHPDWPVLVATRPGNASAIALAQRLGLVRRRDLDHTGYLLFSSSS